MTTPKALITSEGEVVAAKRPATALYGLGAVFMGKLPNDEHYRILSLPPTALARVRLVVGRMPCPKTFRKKG